MISVIIEFLREKKTFFIFFFMLYLLYNKNYYTMSFNVQNQVINYIININRMGLLSFHNILTLNCCQKFQIKLKDFDHNPNITEYFIRNLIITIIISLFYVIACEPFFHTSAASAIIQKLMIFL